MTTTRRQMMMFAGGAAAGIFVTPAPWRLITDGALLSENWPGIPVPEAGPVTAKFTNCPLCTAGCAVRARCVSDRPVSLAGVAGHPLSRGAMCCFGLAGHHLPYHPARVQSGPAQEAAAAVANGIARCGENERVAVLDLRPGRTASWTYRRAMGLVKNGTYLAPRDPLVNTAIDLTQAKTVLSFGIPVTDGWGTPGNVIAARPNFRLIQVDAAETRTASVADQWLRIQAGTEEVLAQGIFDVLAGKSAAHAAEITGISEQVIAQVAHELKENGPALVLGATDSALRLNEAVSSLGHTIVARREAPVPEAWKKLAAVQDIDSLSDRSVRVLLIDESAAGEYLPWSTIERKLVRDNPVVVAFGWNREGYGRHAHYLLPTAVFPEVVEDIPTAADSVAATFRLSVALNEAPAGVVKPEAFIAKAAGLDIGDSLRERADAIHAAKRGSVYAPAGDKRMPLKDMKVDEFWKALSAGATWIDDPEPGRAPTLQLRAAETRPTEQLVELPLVALAAPETNAAGSPILSKLYRESNLRLGPDRVALHPETARQCGVADGSKAVLQTLAGRYPVEVLVDAGVPKGAVATGAAPAMRDLCAPGARAKVVLA